DIPPPVSELPASADDVVPGEAREVATPARAASAGPAPAGVEKVDEEVGPEPPAPEPEKRPVPRVAAPSARPKAAAPVAAPQPAPPASGPPGEPATPPPPGFEEMRGVKVLGRIDLRRATPPPNAGQAWRPPSEAPSAQPAAADGAPKKKKGRKVIKKPDMANLLERDFHRGGRRPQKRKALPGKEQRKTAMTAPPASQRVIPMSDMIPDSR